MLNYPETQPWIQVRNALRHREARKQWLKARTIEGLGLLTAITIAGAAWYAAVEGALWYLL